MKNSNEIFTIWWGIISVKNGGENGIVTVKMWPHYTLHTVHQCVVVLYIHKSVKKTLKVRHIFVLC